MNMALWSSTTSSSSSSSELTCRCFENWRGRNVNFSVPKQIVRIGDAYSKKGCVQVSCQLMRGPLEGQFMGNKRLEGPNSKLEFVRTLLIDNYDSYTYNIYQGLSTINGLPPVVVRNDEWTWRDFYHYLYEENTFDNIVISPGPGSPASPADIGICLQVLLECWDVPILGVCLGHQALGYAHGAKIIHAPEPVHGRLSEIAHNGCRLLHGIPSGMNSGFKVVRYHSLVIDAESLPKELVPIAWTATDDLSRLENLKLDDALDAYESESRQKIYLHTISTQLKNGSCHPPIHVNGMERRKVLMGIMHSTRPHYGVQFHPESIATCHGNKIFRNFREITEDYWLRLRPSFIQERNVHYTGCMQVPNADKLLREIPRISGSLNNSDELYRGGLTPGQLACDGNESSFGMFHLANFRHPSIGIRLLRMKWRKFEHLASQVGGSRNIFYELFGNNKAENTFWLDSSSIEKGRARFSFMGGKGESLWKQMTFRLSDQSDKFMRGGHLSIKDARGSTKSTYLEDGFFNFLDKELLSFHYKEKDYEGLPFDFYGGYIGYIGYNLKVECGASSNRHKSKTPDACFFFADNLVVIDHLNDDVYILSLHEENATVSTWLDDTEKKLIGLRTSTRQSEMQLHAPTFSPRKSSFILEKSREDYVNDVQNCLKYIKDGESYELCLTTQLRKKVKEIDSLGLYLHLREKNPSPYAAWLNFSMEELCICCSSPERFLRLDKNDMLEAKPIKGTIARGSSPEEDEQLKLQLQYSEKDQAENLMIVDLLRNDLGRVCEPGSVHVPHLMDVESYATVHTMVSTIRGKKQSNVGAVDCVRAAFPGGSMTGAPKLRSMELLDSIESCSRGIYSGSIGFFSYNRTFDLNIVIRTVVIHEGEASIGAGGAIVTLSNPEDEYEEMILKTRAPANAVMEFD